jgi:hypothetical protein
MVGKNQHSNLDLNVRQTLYVSKDEDLKNSECAGLGADISSEFLGATNP